MFSIVYRSTCVKVFGTAFQAAQVIISRTTLQVRRPYNSSVYATKRDRRYADELFHQKLEEITPEYQEKVAQIRRDSAARGLIGSEFKAIGRAHIERIGRLAQAKVEGLLKAYEKQGLEFDDKVREEVSAEVQEFCVSSERGVINVIAEMARQAFGNNTPEGFQNAIASEVSRGVGGIIASQERQLRISAMNWFLMKEG